jgi:uncharacterized protein (TIGR02171 family)
MNKIAVCFSLMLVVLTCSPNKPRNVTPDSSYAGMHKISAKGLSFMQGAADSLAKTDEKPVMKSAFTYDYWLDTTEVTQQEYFNVTGKKPVGDTGAYGIGNDYPVYKVTWYDAILFCNAKSKLFGLDTVYTYYGLETSDYSAVGAATVIIHYSKNGFRLPTEAEWEYAAREGTSTLPFPHQSNAATAQEYAWFYENSGNTTHPVAMQKPDKFGLYDMAGNVFEWTNDWKTSYGLSSITNSAGAPESQYNKIKVIKGGAYNSQLYGMSSIRPSGRSTVYATIAATAETYIGFRCARGVFTSPGYITDSAISTRTNPSYPAITSLYAVTGTTRAKLAYVNITGNKRTLCYIAYGTGTPTVIECGDSVDVYFPALSPDGKYVAYCTRDAGASGKSSIYIRSTDSITTKPTRLPADSAFIPRWWVDRTSNDTFLIYTNSAVDNSTSSWNSTKTCMVKMFGRTAAGTPLVLCNNGSFYGGRSANGAYVVTGYKNLLLQNLSSSTTQQLFMYPHNGKTAGASAQVCNVSMSPDTNANGTALFLDFGYSGKSSIVGTSYGVHEYLFTVNAKDSVAGWYRCPTGEDSWDYPRWSNYPLFAASCVRNTAGASHAIYFINLGTAQATKLVEGTELSQPSLWVNAVELTDNYSFNLDSLGRYDIIEHSGNQLELAYKLHYFWANHNKLEIICAGDSRGADGFSPSRFIGFSSYNLCFGGGDFQTAATLIQHYIFNHCPKTKMILMSVLWEGFYYFPDMNSSNFGIGFGYSYGYNYDKNHNFWSDGLPQGFDSLMHAAEYPATSIVTSPGVYDIDSFGNNSWDCKNTDKPVDPIFSGDTSWDTGNSSFRSNMAVLKKLADMAAARGIHILVVNCPVNALYAQKPNYSYWGPSQQTAKNALSIFKTLEKANPYFHFYDAHNFGNHPYRHSDFVDDIHLCHNGAEKLSDSINIRIHTILGQ